MISPYPHTGGDLTVKNIQNLVITQLPWPNGNLTLENIKPWFVDNMPGPNQAPSIEAGTTFRLRNVDILLPKDYAYSIFYFHPHGDGTYLFEDCLFDAKISLSVEGKKPNNITFRRSKIKLSVGVIGGAPVFEECEFGGDVTLYNRTAATFTKNVFWGKLNFINSSSYDPIAAWNATGADLPTIDQNSFYGQYALYYQDKCSFVDKVPSPIPIGSSNYFGDSQGFVRLADPCTATNVPDRFLMKRGAIVTDTSIMGQVFDISGFASSPTNNQTDKRVQPSFWLINSIIGQNTIPHDATLPASPLVQGKETLFCMELGTNDNRGVEGLKVYAKIGGNIVQTTSIPAVRRDVSSYTNSGGRAIGGARSIINGMATVNFILPPVTTSSATVEIYLDQSAISGYDFDGDGVDDPGPRYQPRLLTKTLTFDPPYGRTLNILFHTVKIERGPFSDPWQTKTNALTRTRNALISYMPAMFPIRTEDLALYPLEEQMVITNADTTTGLLNAVAPIMELTRRLFEKDRSVSIDFQVAVLPANSMGKDISGANFSSRREILFVDEDKLTAVLHEMGHGLGMYRKEQYDQFPPDGLQFKNATAFVGSPKASIDWMIGKRRIQHVVATDNPHYSYQDWMDLMSRSDYPVWPIPGTLSSFYSAFRSRLGTGVSGIQSLSIDTPSEYSISSSTGATRILLFANTAKVIEGGIDLYSLQPGAIRAMAFDPSVLPSLPADTDGPGNAYRLEALDASGAALSSQEFYVAGTNPYDGDTLPDSDVWYATFDIPEGSEQYRISRIADGQQVFEVLPGGNLSCDMVSPAPGSSLGDTVQIKWNVTQSTPVNAGQPVRSMIFFSSNGGATWQPSTLFQETTSINIATESLPSGTDIVLRVVSSDGLRYCSKQVGGLTIGNRPPTVNIILPREGDRAPVAFAWTLAAEAFDVESGPIDTGLWESSIDGEIGTGPYVEGVRLSTGTHTLTYRASDADSTLSYAQIQVTVDDQAGVDLCFAEDALRVTPPGTDPVYQPTVAVLKTGDLHSAAVEIRNGGIAATCDMELYMEDPQGGETLIASQSEVSLLPFEEVLMPASFTPETDGTYRFRAVVTNITPNDVNSSNNERIWTFFTETTSLSLSPLTSESWAAQSLMPIDWIFSGYAGESLGIELLQDGATISTLASAHPIGSDGSGSFSWKIPRDFPVGTGYRIKITSLSESSVYAISPGSFEIMPPEPAFPDVITILNIMVGLPVTNDAMTSIRDIDANSRVGLPEAIFILQKTTDLRQ